MELIQDQPTVLNVWHITDAKTIGINWVKGSIPQWKEKAYSIPKQHILWRDHKLEIDAAVERNEYGATVTLWIKHDGKDICIVLPSLNGWEAPMETHFL